MSYEKGMVRLDTDYEHYNYETECYDKLAFQLPHSCDAWVIGGEAEARQLIADLEDLLVKREKGI